MPDRVHWLVALTAVFALYAAFGGARAAEGDYVVQGGGGGGGGSSIDPDAGDGGGGGASYWGMAGPDGDNYGAGAGGSGEGVNAGAGGGLTTNNGGSGGGVGDDGDAGGAPGSAWDDGKNGWNADATKGQGGTGDGKNAGGGGAGAHATSDGESAYVVDTSTGGLKYNDNGVVFDLKETPEGFDVSAGSELIVEAGHGGGGGIGDGVMNKGGAGGVGGDAALEITNTGTDAAVLGTIVVTGGDAGGSIAAMPGGTSGTGGSGGRGLVVLSTDLTVDGISITSGAGADLGAGKAGSAALIGRDNCTLTVTGNGTVSVTAGAAGLATAGGSATLNVAGFKADAGTTATLDVSQAASGAHIVAVGTLDASAGDISVLLDNRDITGVDTIKLGDFVLADGGVISLDAGTAGGAQAGRHFEWTGTEISVTGNGVLRYDGVLDLTEAIGSGGDEYKTIAFDFAGWDETTPLLSIEDASGVRTGALKIDDNTNIIVELEDFGLIVEKKGFGGSFDLTTESVEGSYVGAVAEYALEDGYGGYGVGAYRIFTTDESAVGAGDAKLVVKDQNRLHSAGWSVGGDTAWGSDNARGEADFQFKTLNLVDSAAGTGYGVTFSRNDGKDSLFHVGELSVRTAEAVTLDVSSMNAYDSLTSTVDGAYLGGIALRRGADLTLIGEQDVNFSWGKTLAVTDSAALAINHDLDVKGGTLSFLLTENYDATLSVLNLSGAGRLVADADTGVDIRFSGLGRDIAAGSVITLVDGNFDGDALNGVVIDSWDGAYNTQFTLDTASAAGSLLADVLHSGIDRDLVHNMLMGGSALTALLVGGADAAAASAGGFIPMAPVGGEFSGAQVGGYGSFGAGNVRIDTGSHIKSNDIHALAGIGVRLNHGASHTDVGVFFESGWGNYDTHNAYASGGDSRYTGAGVLYRHDTNTGLYGEASFRAGSARSEYDGVRALANRAGTSFDYSMRSLYYGGHVGLGFIRKPAGGRTSLDLTVKALWTHLDGKSARIRNTNDHLVLDDTNSSRSRVGGKYNYHLDAGAIYGSLAWEHEFNGKTTGVYRSASQGDSKIKAASIRGSSVVAEVGGEWRMTERASVGGSVYGIIGKRRGFGGSVNLMLGF